MAEPREVKPPIESLSNTSQNPRAEALRAFVKRDRTKPQSENSSVMVRGRQALRRVNRNIVASGVVAVGLVGGALAWNQGWIPGMDNAESSASSSLAKGSDP